MMAAIKILMTINNNQNSIRILLNDISLVSFVIPKNLLITYRKPKFKIVINLNDSRPTEKWLSKELKVSAYLAGLKISKNSNLKLSQIEDNLVRRYSFIIKVQA